MGHIGDIGRGPRGNGLGHGPKGPATSSGGGLTPADSVPTTTTTSAFEGAGEPRTRPGPPEGTPRAGRPTDAPAFEKGPREGRSTPPEPRPGRKADDFGGATKPAPGGLLGGGEARAPVRPVRELVPAKLATLTRSEGVAQRFASEAALLDGQVRPRSLPASERTQRLWAFFTAYAEAAAAHEPHPDTPEIFLATLEEGLGGYHDAASGQDALALARWVLSAPTPEEARARAESVQLEPPPEVLLAESAPAPEHAEPTQAQRPGRELRDSAFTPDAERSPLERPTERAQPGAVLHPPPPALSQRGPAEADARVSGSRLSGSDRRLGSHMLWNVLHHFRASPEESAQLQATWSRVAFGAVLALVGLALAGVVLLSL